jgi:hypothetical protein
MRAAGLSHPDQPNTTGIGCSPKTMAGSKLYAVATA